MQDQVPPQTMALSDRGTFLGPWCLQLPGAPGDRTPRRCTGTSAAQTVAAELTQVAVASPTTSAPTDTPVPPTEAPVATDTIAPPSPTAGTAGCTDKASFVTDVTVPDNTFVASGASFTKTWRLQNTGTCTWNTGYALVFDSGNAMGGPGSVAMPASVAPNATIDISINLTAPTSNGNYKGNYKLRNEKGIVFGIGASADVAFWVLNKRRSDSHRRTQRLPQRKDRARTDLPCGFGHRR